MATAAKPQKTRKKRQKVLIQIGIVIILLFSLVTITISNMVTMSSFSTSATNMILSITEADREMISYLEGFNALPWLLEYWTEHAKTLADREVPYEERERLTETIRKMDAYSVMYLTVEQMESLTPEEREAVAVIGYEMTQSWLTYLQEEGLDADRLIVTIPGSSDDEALLLFDSTAGEYEMPIGQTVDMRTVLDAAERTESVIHANPQDWAFRLPAKDMVFASITPLPDEGADVDVRFTGFFTADSVYGQMLYTNDIRNFVILMLAVAGALILTFLYWSVMRPLAAVKRCVSEYAGNKDAEAVARALSGIRSRNEIGVFADEFSAVAREMDRYTREVARLAGERERAAAELNVAAAIQTQMLPRTFPDRREFSLYASMDPAREVGGDFYDFYFIDDDHLALTIADVSDKGVPAALFMAVSRTMLKNRTLMGGTPARILEDVNERLCEGNDSSMFVTVWHGILTISTGALVCANAGHEFPGLRLGETPFELVRTRHGPMLGAFEGVRYRDETYRLAPEDALFLYTDGVPEATAADGSRFGLERLTNALRSVPNGETPRTVLKTVRDAVDGFTGDAPQFDDLTMLCLVRHTGG